MSFDTKADYACLLSPAQPFARRGRAAVLALLGAAIVSCRSNPPAATAGTTASTASAPTSPASQSSGAPMSVDVTGTIEGKKVVFLSAVAWKLRDTAYVAILSTKRLDCAALTWIPNRDRLAYEPDRLDLVITEQIGAGGATKWALKHIEPFGGLSGDMNVSVDRDPAQGISARVNLDMYEKEGPTLKLKGTFEAKPCGALPAPTAKATPRPQPDLELEIGGRKISLSGAIVLEFGKALAPELLLDTGAIGCDDRYVQSALGIRWSSKDARDPNSGKPSVAVYGDRVPRSLQNGQLEGKASTKIEGLDGAGPTATLDWDFQREGILVKAKGKVRALRCHDDTFDKVPGE